MRSWPGNHIRRTQYPYTLPRRTTRRAEVAKQVQYTTLLHHNAFAFGESGSYTRFNSERASRLYGDGTIHRYFSIREEICSCPNSGGVDHHIPVYFIVSYIGQYRVIEQIIVHPVALW